MAEFRTHPSSGELKQLLNCYSDKNRSVLDSCVIVMCSFRTVFRMSLKSPDKLE